MASACFVGHSTLEPTELCFMIKHIVHLGKCLHAFKIHILLWLWIMYASRISYKHYIFFKYRMSSQYFVLLLLLTVFRCEEKMSLVVALLLWWDSCSRTGEWLGDCKQLLPQWSGWRHDVGNFITASGYYPTAWLTEGLSVNPFLPHPPKIEKKLPFLNLEKQPISH